MPQVKTKIKQVKVSKGGEEFLVPVVHENDYGFTIEHNGHLVYFLDGQTVNSKGYANINYL